MGPKLLAAALTAVGLLATGADARAFPTESAVAPGCHEAITMRSLRSTRAVRAEARPLDPVTPDDRAFLDDQQFDIDADMTDLGAVALLTGVRFPDLRGQAPNEVDELAKVHGDASRQREHCLRAIEHDEPSGTEAALRECRAFIREKIADALDGVDASGVPTASDRVPVAVDLSLRGGVELPLPSRPPDRVPEAASDRAPARERNS